MDPEVVARTGQSDRALAAARMRPRTAWAENTRGGATDSRPIDRPAQPARLLIVIVNYRTSDLTVACLQTLEADVRAIPRSKVVVTDNGSRDGSAERIRKAIDDHDWTDWVSLLSLDCNGGFACGNNAVIRPALESSDPLLPEYVLLLNPDTLIRPGAVLALLEFMDSHPNAGIAGSRLENPDGSPQYSCHRFHTLWSEVESGMRLGVISRLLTKRLVAPFPENKTQVMDWVCGASMIIRRRVFEDIGLLDPGYFLYFEEVDFCLHAQKAGWECWYVPGSKVVHLEGQSTGMTNTPVRQLRRPRYWFESRRRYFEKNHGLAYALLADVLWATSFAVWRVRRVLQRKPDPDPPHMLWDFLRFSLRPHRRRPRAPKEYPAVKSTLASVLVFASLASAQSITHVSVDSFGAQANGRSDLPAISADGRTILFQSAATNLVPMDTNGAQDAFVHDSRTDTTRRVSVSTSGVEGNADSFSYGAPSGDGRYVAFWSYASNLVTGDTNGGADVFLRDMVAGTTVRVSVALGGGDPDGESVFPVVSADGRYVLFESNATNLGTQGTNAMTQVFVRDMLIGNTQLVSVDSAGTMGNDDSLFGWISADGRYVGFQSYADNLVPNDTNGVRDSFLRDRWLGATERVSVSSSGVQGDSHSDGCVVSHDGRYAFFNSMATNLAQANGFASWQTYRHDRRTGLTECVSVNSSGIAGNGGGDFDPVISADGRYVAFDTTSTNLDSCHAFFWNVFLHDCALGTTERISIGPAGHPVRGNSFKPSISETGRYVSFFSYSRAIAPPDTNEVPDVFVWDRGF